MDKTEYLMDLIESYKLFIKNENKEINLDSDLSLEIETNLN